MATLSYDAEAVVPTKDQFWPSTSLEGMGDNSPRTDPGLAALAEDFANDRIRIEGIKSGSSYRYEEQGILQVGDKLWYRDIEPPSGSKGALWATAPDSPERGDVLFFSRYPTTIPYELSANVVSEDTSGRAFPAMQHLGAKGVKVNLDLLFYDAFIDTKRYASAAAAKLWFDMYVIGHDGTGASVPFAHIFFQVGGAPPIRVMIHDVTMVTARFNRNDEPQSVEAKVAISVWEPVYLISPFKPKAVVHTRTNKHKKKINLCVCPTVVGTLPGVNSGANIKQDAQTQSLDAVKRLLVDGTNQFFDKLKAPEDSTKSYSGEFND